MFSVCNCRCVRLGKFDTERTITFIPPDGEFELMKFRVAAPAPPFRVLPTIEQEGKNALMVNVKINSDYPEDVRAAHVVVKIPMPPTAAAARCLSST
jgi:AP-2 complex subunit mu-1